VEEYTTLVDRGNFLEKCLLLSTINTTAQKLEWYQTSAFTTFIKTAFTLLAVAGVVMAFMDGGFTAGLISIATAAVLGYLAMELVLYVFEKTDNKYARAAAVIIAVAAMSYGISGGNIGLDVTSLLTVVNASTTMGMVAMSAIAAEDNAKFAEELQTYQDYSSKLNEMLKEYEIDKSFLFRFNEIFVETPEQFEYRTQELDVTEVASDIGMLTQFGMEV
jgi:hypothetical protein